MSPFLFFRLRLGCSRRRSTRRPRLGGRAHRLALPAVGLLATALIGLQPVGAQTQSPRDPAAQSSTRSRGVGADIKAYVTAPGRWRGKQWLKLGAAVAAVSAAYQYDDRVRAHFDTQTTAMSSHDNRDAHDAIPAAAAFAGTWIYATVIDSDDGRREAAAMLEAAGFGSATAYAIKSLAGRQRPYETSDPGRWHAGGDAFPSLHVTAAFAVGTVLAESGNDHFRWLRRVLGYGIAAGTAYERLDHGDHWLSDAVAGAGLGIASAHFAMHRRYGRADGAALSLTPLDGGLRLGYTVALRR